MFTTPEAPPESGGMWSKLGAALPVALAAIATAFAGISSGEMARAMFWRSAAAQDQAKAASQWTLAGFKRDRALIVQTTAALATPADPPIAPPAGVDAATWATARRWLLGDGPPPAELPALDERVAAAASIAKDRSADEDARLRAAAGVPLPVIAEAIRAAEDAVERYDREWTPILVAAEKAGRGSATRFELEGRRYSAEARLNQEVSGLYELRVRRTTAESERHRRRSENFFYAMLVAQVGATGGSLALAGKRKSPLWLLAGLTGLVSVGFGGYVYLVL